jgi:hypothetical protein
VGDRPIDYRSTILYQTRVAQTHPRREEGVRVRDVQQDVQDAVAAGVTRGDAQRGACATARVLRAVPCPVQEHPRLQEPFAEQRRAFTPRVRSSSPLPTLFPHQVGSIQHVFHHVVIKIRQLFLRPAA